MIQIGEIYQLNDKAVVDAEFRTVDNVLTDPSTITVTFQRRRRHRWWRLQPKSTFSTGDPKIVKTSTGVYRITSETLNLPGLWEGKIYATGLVTDQIQFQFWVDRDNIDA